MKRLMNALCSVSSRLFNHRVVVVGYKIEGKVSANAIRGIPKYVVLINWSKKLTLRVSFKRFSPAFEA